MNQTFSVCPLHQKHNFQQVFPLQVCQLVLIVLSHGYAQGP